MTKRKPAAAKALVPKREPNAQERAAIEKARAYCLSRTQPIAYEVKKIEGGNITVQAPHNDLGAFEVLQRATFGTVSPEFANRTAGEVGNIMRSAGKAMPEPDQLNAGIAAVAGIEPQNEAEAMLAVQMVGTHSVAMEMLSKAKHATNTDQLERFGTLATKLLRTYTTQLEALAKIRRGGSQKVTVEHVHVYSGGQAIVGNVTGGQGGAGGGRIENGSQSHAPALTGPAALALRADPQMLCPDAGRDALHVAGREGESPMPDARRGQRDRGSEG